MTLSEEQIQNINTARNPNEELGRILNANIPEEISNYFSDQGGWPQNESIVVGSVEISEELIKATCTIEFDEVVNCGCGQSCVPHVHYFGLAISANSNVKFSPVS